LFELGNRTSNAGKWGEAVEWYAQALQVEPRHEWALNNKGYCLAQLEWFDEAIEVLRRAIAVNARNVMAHANLVMAMNRAKRDYESIPYRRRLTQLKPNVFEYAFDLANTLQSVGRVDESLFYYRRAISLSPERKAAISNYVLALNYSDELTPEFVALEHFRLAQHWSEPSTARPRMPNATWRG